MLYAFYGFLFGIIIPYLARRFAKFMPATFGYALYRIIWPVKRVSSAKRKATPAYAKLMEKYFMRSLGWGVVSGALSYGAFCIFGSATASWYLILIWISLLLYEIDERMFLLPDLLTVPLLIAGFLFSAFHLPQADPDWFSPAQLSALGALAGYFLPVLASLFLIRKHPEAFGGGDIKFLSACGAWLGLEAVPYLILSASFVFGVMMLIKRQRTGAFGPAIVIAVLGLVFFLN